MLLCERNIFNVKLYSHSNQHIRIKIHKEKKMCVNYLLKYKLLP